MEILTAPAPIVRRRFVEAFPAQKGTHRQAQCEFFAAANAAGLSRDRDARLRGISAFLGRAVASSTELSPVEYAALAIAVDADAFYYDWTLTGAVVAHATVELMPVAYVQVVNEIHLESRESNLRSYQASHSTGAHR